MGRKRPCSRPDRRASRPHFALARPNATALPLPPICAVHRKWRPRPRGKLHLRGAEMTFIRFDRSSDDVPILSAERFGDSSSSRDSVTATVAVPPLPYQRERAGVRASGARSSAGKRTSLPAVVLTAALIGAAASFPGGVFSAD